MASHFLSWLLTVFSKLDDATAVACPKGSMYTTIAELGPQKTLGGWSFGT